MKKKRTWIIIGVVVVVIAAGGVYLATRQTANGQAARNFLANAQTVKVVRTTLSNAVDSTGSINPEAKVQLSFGTSGTIAKVNVAVGDRVKKGETLATLDTTDLQLKVTQAEQSYLVQQLTYSTTVQADPGDISIAQAAYNSALASYNAARQDYNNLGLKQSVQCSQLTTAQNNLNRAQAAYDRLANDHQAKNYLNSDWGPFQSVVRALTDAQSAYNLALANCNIAKTGLNDSALRSAQAQLQSAKSNLDNLISPRVEKQIQAKAQLEQARLSLEQAKQSLADATIVAPFEGVVTLVNITAGGSSGSGAAIEMADTSRLHVDVLVDETQISAIQPQQRVDLTLDAMPGITLTGTVMNIDPAGTISQGVVNYNVRVDLDPTSEPLLLDMTANASIKGETHENVLAVPAAAIRSGGFGGQGGFTGQGGQGGQGGVGGQNGQNGSTGQGNQNGTGGQNRQGGQRVQGSFVLVMENGQPRPVQVTVGMTAGDLTEVSGDLKEGDEILILTTTRTQNGSAGFGGPGGGGFFGGPGGGGPPPF